MTTDLLTAGNMHLSAYTGPRDTPMVQLADTETGASVSMSRDLWRHIVALCGIEYLRDLAYSQVRARPFAPGEERLRAQAAAEAVATMGVRAAVDRDGPHGPGHIHWAPGDRPDKLP